jgi:four helix bundle protein
VTVRKYNELLAWQKAMDLVVNVYEVSRLFPKEELYGLTSQLRRAVVSVPSNIAEGQSRAGSRDFLRYLSISRGSLSEVETQLIIAERLGYLSEERLTTLLKSSYEVGALIHGLSVAIGKRLSSDSPLATRHSPLQ